MEILGVLLALGILFSQIGMPFLLLYKLNRIADRLDHLEQSLKIPQTPPRMPQKSAVAAPKPPEPAVAAPKPPEPAVAAPKPPPPESPEIPQQLSPLEKRTREIALRTWNWIVVGEEFRNPSVTREYALATTWLIRIGFVILLCGIGFFLKYSIDRNWMQPGIRVMLMVLSGLAMALGGAWKSSGKYRNFSVALSGAGFVTLYLSIMAAFRLYHLIDAIPAFACMAVVTAAAMSAAMGCNALLPALLGCVGGFLTPVFIETGSGDLTKLFLYMTVLTAGTLFTAWFRNWVLLHWAALISYGIVGGAALERYSALVLVTEYTPSLLILLSVNFALFTFVVFASAQKRDAALQELLLLTGNGIFYFVCAIPMAKNGYDAWKLSAVLSLYGALLAMAQSLWIRKKLPQERPLYQMFLAAETAFCLALTVPLLLGGVWITAGWALLAFLMLAMALRSRSRTLLIMALLLYGVMMVRQCASGDGFGVWESYAEGLWNRLLAVGSIIVSLAAGTWMSYRMPPEAWLDRTGEAAKKHLMALGFGILSGGLFLWYTSLELHTMLKSFLPGFRNGGVSVWWSILACVLLWMGITRKRKPLRLTAVGLFLACAGKIFLIDLAHLEQIWRIAAFAAIGIVMLSGAILYIRFKDHFVSGEREDV